MTLPNRPPPRPGSSPEPILDEQPERAAVHHTGVDGVPQAPPRKGTLIGLGATKVPLPPQLPLEHARTVPAAAHQARTQRAPSPIEVLAVHVADAPYGQPAPSLPPPSLDPRDAQIAALRARAEAAEARAKESAPPDRSAWAKLGYRVGAAVAGAAVLVITALGARAVSVIESKADATKAAQESAKNKLSTHELEWQNWAARVVAIEECRHLKQSELNARQFPESQRPAAAGWPIWKDECGELPRLP